MSLIEWFAGASKRLAITEVVEVPLHQLTEWRVETDSGCPVAVSHTSGKLYRGTAYRAHEPLRNQYVDRFLFTPCLPPGQMNGVILLARNSDGRFLVQAKAEPGNRTPGCMVLTATIQATWSNLQSQLSGKIPFMELYHHRHAVKRGIVQDGGQFFGKVNEICFLDAPREFDFGEIPDNFSWALRSEIAEFASRGLASEHLLQALGLRAIF